MLVQSIYRKKNIMLQSYDDLINDSRTTPT